VRVHATARRFGITFPLLEGSIPGYMADEYLTLSEFERLVRIYYRIMEKLLA
jgi:acetylornithine deacetylase/succinyl-diaminopimelate desuccinylase-like protein